MRRLRVTRAAWLALLAAVLAGGCSGSPRQAPEAAAPAAPEASAPSSLDEDDTPLIRSFHWDRRIGIAAFEGRRDLVLAAPDDSLPSGTLVTLVWLDEPQRVMRARILGTREQPWSVAGQPVEGRAYELQLDGAPPKQRMFAIAVTGEIGEPKLENGMVLIDLDGDATPESFRQCSSSEGLHLSVWSGSPLTSPECWHRYLYLGMDLQATCTEAEAAGR